MLLLLFLFLINSISSFDCFGEPPESDYSCWYGTCITQDTCFCPAGTIFNPALFGCVPLVGGFECSNNSQCLYGTCEFPFAGTPGDPDICVCTSLLQGGYSYGEKCEFFSCDSDATLTLGSSLDPIITLFPMPSNFPETCGLNTCIGPNVCTDCPLDPSICILQEGSPEITRPEVLFQWDLIINGNDNTQLVPAYDLLLIPSLGFSTTLGFAGNFRQNLIRERTVLYQSDEKINVNFTLKSNTLSASTWGSTPILLRYLSAIIVIDSTIVAVSNTQNCDISETILVGSNSIPTIPWELRFEFVFSGVGSSLYINDVLNIQTSNILKLNLSCPINNLQWETELLYVTELDVPYISDLSVSPHELFIPGVERESTFSCFGIFCSNESLTCSGHGNCVLQDRCSCEIGYGGPECAEICEGECEQCPILTQCPPVYTCFGRDNTDPEVCSGYGECVAPDICDCYTGGVTGSQCTPIQGGGDCSVAECVHGICLIDITGKFCKCHVTSGAESPSAGSSYGSYGSLCNFVACHSDEIVDANFVGPTIPSYISAVPPQNPYSCSLGETCTTVETCVLHQCYGTNSSDPFICDGHGVCVSEDTCECECNEEGGYFYTGDECEIRTNWTVIECPECEECPPVCNPECVNGQCTSDNNCICNSGWMGIDCNIPSCTNGCTAHGTCIEPDVCKCDDEYWGTLCDQECTTGPTVPTCFGYSALDHANVCNGNGDCVLEDTCDCDEGYINNVGGNCVIIQCNGVNYSDPDVCSDNGDCPISGPGLGACDCEEGYVGSDCLYAICNGLTNIDSNVCNGHGQCYTPEFCTCDEYWGGQYCNDPECPEDIFVNPPDCDQLRKCYGIQYDHSTVCSNHGNCIAQDDCECDCMYYGDKCEFRYHDLARLKLCNKWKKWKKFCRYKKHLRCCKKPPFDGDWSDY